MYIKNDDSTMRKTLANIAPELAAFARSRVLDRPVDLGALLFGENR